MMRSATAFLPDSMITFMNLERSTEPNLGSGRMSRLGTSRRRGMTLFLWLQLARTSGAPRAAIETAHLLGDTGRRRLEIHARHGAGRGIDLRFPGRAPGRTRRTYA